MTDEDYEELLASQNGVCAICGEPPEREGRVRTLRPAIDHCHKTGTIRGVLCHKCNTSLGWFERNADAIARYLLIRITNGEK